MSTVAVRRLLAGLCVLAITAAAHAQNKVAGVLEQIPADSAITVVVPNLGAADGDLAAMLGQLPMPVPNAKNPLKAVLSDKLGLANGIDMDASAALVMPVLTLNEPRFYLLVPVKDADAFEKNFSQRQADPNHEGLDQVKLKNSGKVLYTKTAGKWVVLGEHPATVARQAAAQDPGALLKPAGSLAQPVLNDSDAFVYLNMPRVGPILNPMAQMGLAAAQQNMPKDTPMFSDPQTSKVLFEAYGQAVEQILTQSRAVVMGLDVGKTGAMNNLVVQFKPDSAPARLFAPAATTASDSDGGKPRTTDLDRMRDDSYLFAMSADVDALNLKPIIKGLKTQVIPKLPEDSAIRDVTQAYLDSMKLMPAFGNAQAAWYPGNTPKNMFQFAYVYETTRPAEQVRQEYKQMTEQVGAAYEKLSQQIGQGTLEMSYHENQGKIGGLDVDRLDMKFNLGGQQQQQGPMPGMMNTPETLSTYIVAKDKLLIMALSPDTGLLKQTLDAADGSGKLSDREALAESRKGLPKHRFAEMHVNVGGFVEMVMNMMVKMMGGPNAQAPQQPELPPLAMAMTAEAGAVELTTHAPMTFISGLVKMQKNMGAGGPPGGPMPQPGGQPGLQPQGQPGGQNGDAAKGNVPPVSDAQFDAKVLQADKPVLVDFWATWCAPCKQQSPIVEQLAASYGDKAEFYKLDVDKNPDTPDDYQIQAIPTLLLFEDGKLVNKFVGLTSKQELSAAIDKQLK